MKKPCMVCLNSRVSGGELTDENDYSAFIIGKSIKGHRLAILSGSGRPLRIQGEEWNERLRIWETVSTFEPLFCPMCGRELSEYRREGKAENGQ